MIEIIEYLKYEEYWWYGHFRKFKQIKVKGISKLLCTVWKWICNNLLLINISNGYEFLFSVSTVKAIWCTKAHSVKNI